MNDFLSNIFNKDFDSKAQYEFQSTVEKYKASASYSSSVWNLKEFIKNDNNQNNKQKNTSIFLN